MLIDLAHHASADGTAELRGWLTVVWALIVGSATMAGVFVAVRSYSRTGWDRRVATARLVWAELGVRMYKNKDTTTADMGAASLARGQHLKETGQPPPDKGHPRFMRLLGDEPGFHEDIEADGKPLSILTRDLTVLAVTITNNSAEPIGGCTLALRGIARQPVADGLGLPPSGEWERQAGQPAARVVPPDTTMAFRFVVPLPDRELIASLIQVTLGFTDSAGHRWERTETAPPTLIPRGDQIGWFRTLRIKAKRATKRLRERSKSTP